MPQSRLGAQVAQILSDPINLPAPFLDYLLQYAALNPIPSGAVSAPILNSTGLTGATKASRLVGSTTTGAPTQGTFSLGDVVIAQDGHVWICTGAGSPGTWVDASVAPIQGETDVDFNGDIHLFGAGNTMEQASVLTLKSSVSDPITAPSLSWASGGTLSGSTTYTVGYTWTNGSYESAISPTAVSTSPGADALRITLPALPVGVTGFRIYATASGGQKRQAATTYVTSETVSPTTMIAYNSGGAAPPGATSFPAGTAALIKNSSGGTILTGNGRSVYVNNPSNPTVITTAARKMLGLGGTITPNGTTVKFEVLGKTEIVGTTATILLRYGTGSAPANGAAETGTEIGGLGNSLGITDLPFVAAKILTGLTPGTAYWFDLSANTDGGGASTTRTVLNTLHAFDLF